MHDGTGWAAKLILKREEGKKSILCAQKVLNYSAKYTEKKIKNAISYSSQFLLGAATLIIRHGSQIPRYATAQEDGSMSQG